MFVAAGIAIAGAVVAAVGTTYGIYQGNASANQAEAAAGKQEKEMTKSKEAACEEAKVNFRRASLQVGKEMLTLKEAKMKNLSVARSKGGYGSPAQANGSNGGLNAKSSLGIKGGGALALAGAKGK